MTEPTYWFARYSLDPAGRGLVPVAWQGRAVLAGFVGGMVLGGVLCLTLGLLTPFIALGITMFALCAIASAATFIWAAVRKSDPRYTITDYRSGRVPGKASNP